MHIGNVKKRKEYEEENGGGEDVHPDGIQVADPAADHIFPGKKARLYEKILYRCKEFTIEMGYIGQKMLDQVPNGLFWLDIFLSTGGTVSARNFGPAVKTFLFRPYLAV